MASGLTKISAVSVLLAAVVLFTGYTAVSRTVACRPVPPPPPPTAAEDQPVREHIANVGAGQFPDVYYNVSPVSHNTVIIYVTRTDPDFVRALGDTKPYTIHFQTVQYSLATLIALGDRIYRDFGSPAAAGIDVTWLGYGDDIDRVVLQLNTPARCGTGAVILPWATVTKAQHAVDARYGKGRVVVSSYSYVQPVIELQ